MKCEARITRTYKRAKADSVWVKSPHGLPVCGGDIKVTVKVEGGGGGCPCCSEPVRLSVVASCTKCKNGFNAKMERVMEQLNLYPHDELDITDFLEE